MVDLNNQGLCSRPGCLCDDWAPSMPVGQSKPSSPRSFRVPTLVPSLWLQNQMGATFLMWFWWLFIWPRSASRGSIPEDGVPTYGQDGAHCFASGRLGSWCQLLGLPQEGSTKNLSVPGSSVFNEAPAGIGPHGLFKTSPLLRLQDCHWYQKPLADAAIGASESPSQANSCFSREAA